MGGEDPLGLVGTTLDERIVIDEVVGEGGFGVVYRGRHLGFDEPVAVKFLKLPDQLGETQRADVLRRVKREARLLYRLSSKTAHIVQALDVGAWPTPSGARVPYIAMEWLTGITLEQDLLHRRNHAEPPRSLESAVELLAPAAEALGIAHGYGVVHLDVKPGNLFLCVEDDQVQIKVLDFGVAKVFSSSKTLSRARTAGTQGLQAFTPAYAAPEQFDVRYGQVGAHTDVFALALILLELASGEPVLKGDTPLQLYMSAVSELTRPTFAGCGVSASAEAEKVLATALAIESVDRYRDASAMWTALTAAVGGDAPRERPKRSTAVPPAMVEAATMASSRVHTTGHHRLCTVMVVELRGTGALDARLDPEQVAQITERCMERPRRDIEQRGGMVHELAGGRIVAVFGLGADEQNAAERAVSSALRVREAVRDFHVPHRAFASSPLGVTAGIHTGRVYVSAKGTSRISGTPLTFANQLQRRAAAGAILVGRDTQRQIAGRFDLEVAYLPPLAEDEVEAVAFRVLGPARARHDLGVLARVDFLGVTTQFIGREEERGRLNAVMDAVLEARHATGASRSHQVLLVGERGLGKSRLLVELASELRREGFFVMTAACEPTQTQVSYRLAATLLGDQFRLHDDEPLEVAEPKLRAGIAALREDAPPSHQGSTSRRGGRDRLVEDVVDPLLRILGLGPEREVALEREGQEQVRARIAAAFASLVQLPGKPVAILCDDVQWADSASLAMLDEVSLRLDHPMLVVAAAQPTVFDRHARWASSSDRDRIDVKPLSRRHVEQMLRDRLRLVDAIPEELVTHLVERAEGSPLVLVELLHYLVDVGAIQTGPERWALEDSQASNVALPTTVQAVVQARLDRLGQAGTDLLCHAAVVGQSLWAGALAALMERSEADIAGTLRKVLSRQFLREEATSSFPDERELRFAETSTREVAYAMLGSALRKTLHRRVAEWLDERRQGDAMAARVAEHYERSGAALDACEAYACAGRHAASLGHNEDAIALFESALEIDEAGELGVDGLDWEVAPDDSVDAASWSDRAQLRFELADVLRRAGSLDEAEARLEEAQKLVDPAAASAEVASWGARIGYRLAMLGELRGDVDVSLSRLDEAMRQAETAAMPVEKAQMLAMVAALELRRGDERAGERACVAGLRVLRAVSPRGPRWREACERLLRTLGGARYHRGRFVGAERCYLQALRVIDERAAPHLACRIYNNVAAARYARGDVEAARRSFTSALELAERGGEMVVIMTALANLGEVELALGNAEVAAANLEEATAIGDRVGAAGDLADAYRNLAAARLSLGRHDEAIDAGARALELARSERGRVYLPHVVRTITDVCMAVGPSRSSTLRAELRRVAEATREEHPDVMRTCLETLG